MKMSGRLDMQVSFKEARLIQDLLDKYEAKPMKKYFYKSIEGFDYICPTCENIIQGKDNYCKVCGQRIDNQNIAF